MKSGAIPVVVSSVLLFVANAALHAQTTVAEKPLTKAQVYDLVASGLDSQRIVDAVQQRGIDFTPREGLLEALAKKGANQTLLDALRAAAPTPLSKSELVHMLAVGKTSDSVQAIVERRKIDFKPTDEDLDTLRIAGASEGLIKAVREAKLPSTRSQLPIQPTVTYIQCPAEKNQIEVYAEPNTAATVITSVSCGVNITVLAKDQGQIGFDRIRTAHGIEGYVFDRYIATTTSTTPEGDDLFSVGGGVTAPIPIYSPDPSYTKQARKDKVSGTVVVQIIVDTAGDVRDVKVVKPLGHGLDETAIETIRTWQFKPAMRNGSPVNVRMLVETSFRLF